MDPTILASLIGGVIGILISLILTFVINLAQRRRHTQWLKDWNAEQVARYQRGVQ